MRALIAKEWRENRWLILGFVLLAPLLSLGLKWGVVGWRETIPVDSVKVIIPILALLYVLAVGADLIASDASSGRIGFLYALPVRAAKVWAAKTTFLFASAAIYLGYLGLVEWAVLGFAGKPAEEMFTAHSLRWLWLLLPVAVVGAAALAMSALVDRGLAAAILALLLVAGIAWGISRLTTVGVRLKPGDPTSCVLAALVGGGFLAASLAAVTLGRIHLGCRFRRVALAAAAFFLVIAPPTAWAGARAYRWRHIRPHHEDIRISTLLDVDPAGEWALVAVTRPKDGAPYLAHDPFVEWAVSLLSGQVRDLTDLGWAYNRVDTWSEGPGRAVVYREEREAEGKSSVWLRVVYDLEKGEVVSTRPVAPGAPHPIRAMRRGPLVMESRYDEATKKRKQVLLRDGREDLGIPSGWMISMTARDWGLVLLWPGKGEGPKYGVLMTDTGELRPLPVWPGLFPSSPDRHGWTVKTWGTTGRTDCRIDRIPLDGTPAVTVVEGKGRGVGNGQGTRALAYIDGEAWWVEADADEPVLLPDVRFGDPEPEMHWSSDGEICLASDGVSAFRITASEGGPGVEAIEPPRLAEDFDGRPVWFDGRRWLMRSQAEDRLLLVDLDGSTRQLLPAPEGAR